jgi:hypothetical protein
MPARSTAIDTAISTALSTSGTGKVYTPKFRLFLDENDAGLILNGGSQLRTARYNPNGGKATIFNGSNRYFDADVLAPLLHGAENGFTMGCNINTRFGSTQTICHIGNQNAGQNGFRLATNFEGKFQCATNGNFDSLSTKVVNDGSDIHVLCTYDGSKLRIYCNGVFDSEHTLAFNTITGSSFNIGIGSDDTTVPWEGVIDNLVYYDEVIPDSLIFAEFQAKTKWEPFNDSSLLAWLDAHNFSTLVQSAGSVSQINDLSSSGNNFTQSLVRS